MREQSDYRVMSFNLRVDTEHDGINAFSSRKERIAELILKEAPDVVGFQEVVESSGAYLREALFSDYDIVGCGRDGFASGEGIFTAYRRDRLSLISYETLWLSDTPTVPGSFFLHSDQSHFPRVMQKLLFHSRTDATFLRAVNIHLDHTGEDARRRELEFLIPHLRFPDYPAVLTGDFNDEPGSPVLMHFSTGLAEFGWKDATEGLPGSFHNYGRQIPPKKIDYVFTNCPYKNSRVLVRPPKNGVYDSDHYPVTADICTGKWKPHGER